jgi:hypothetical protein
MPSSWSVLITLHAIEASYSLIFGAVNLLRQTKAAVFTRSWAESKLLLCMSWC